MDSIQQSSQKMYPSEESKKETTVQVTTIPPLPLCQLPSPDLEDLNSSSTTPISPTSKVRQIMESHLKFSSEKLQEEELSRSPSEVETYLSLSTRSSPL